MRRPGVVTIAAIASAIGLLPVPYEYHVLLRFFLCGLSVFFLTRPAGIRDVERWILTGIVVLYNPIVPIELGSRAVWGAAYILTVGYFWVLSRRAAGPPAPWKPERRDW